MNTIKRIELQLSGRDWRDKTDKGDQLYSDRWKINFQQLLQKQKCNVAKKKWIRIRVDALRVLKVFLQFMRKKCIQLTEKKKCMSQIKTETQDRFNKSKPMTIGVKEDWRILPGESSVERFQFDSLYWEEVFFHQSSQSYPLYPILEISCTSHDAR